MGIYDILQEHNMSYKELTNLIHELGGCIFLDTFQTIRQLDELYDDKEYKRDFPPQKQYVWAVRQTQPAEYYQDRTIAVFDNQEQAERLARSLNEQYGYGVRFDENHDYIESDDDYDYDDVHYYDWVKLEINPNENNF